MTNRVTRIPSFFLALLAISSVAAADNHHTTPTPIPTSMAEAKAKVVPLPANLGVKRVLLVILENGDPKDAASWSFLRFLTSTGAVLDHSFAVAHPSQPNYIALISGSIADISDGDDKVTVDRDHLGKALDDRWRAYVEDYPGPPPGGTGCNLVEGSGGPFKYVRRHVPFLSFTDVQAGDCHQIIAEDEHLTKLGSDLRNGTLPDFALLIPDLQHDGHFPSNMRIADRWLTKNLQPLLTKDPQLVKDLVVIVTFDEDDHTDASHENRVYTVFWGDHVVHGPVTDAAYDHYDLLATIEALLHVQKPALPAGSRPIGGIWK
jgi:acid phosphatase